MKSLLSNLQSLTGRRAARLIVVLFTGLVLAASVTVGLRAVSAGAFSQFGITEPSHLGQLIEWIAPRARPATRAAASPKAAPATPFAAITVDTTVDENGASASCSLREAITAANTDAAFGGCPAGAGTDTITITATGTISLSSALPDLNSNLTIAGPGASSLIISGNNSHRPFFIASGKTVTLSGLTIANGHIATEGAGIRNLGTLTLNNCVVRDNNAGQQAGGIQNNGPLTITNSTISHNTCGLAEGGGITTYAALTVTGSTISNNTANGSGGGIAVDSSGADRGSLAITNSTISGNQANVAGGGIMFDTTLSNTITNCTITQNRQINVGTSGGGIRVFAGAVTLKNTIVAANTGQNGSVQSDIVGNVAAASSFNLIGTGGSGGLNNGVNNNQVGVADAKLAPLGNYGGLTQTHALCGNSPAVNAGTSAGAPTTDQRGVTRSTVDIGAFEANITLSPSTLPAATLGTAYSQPLSASGGTPSYSFAVASGSLPTGLMLDPSSGLLSGTPSASGSFALIITATGADGLAGAQCYTLTINAPPTITPINVTRQQGNQPTNLQIATVVDAEDAENNLVVTVNDVATATVNGVTINNLTVNAAGQVRTDLFVTCTATDASFTLTVTDSGGATAAATLAVTVPANTAPAVGNYPDTTVLTGGTLIVTPNVAPTDNNTITSVTAVAAPATFTGAFTGNTSSGGVSVTGANPPGDYTITVTLTDNCNATTTRSFTLTVNSCGATLSKPRELFAANGGNDSFTVTINAGCPWTAVSDTPDWITVTAPIGTANGSGTVGYTVASHSNPTRRLGSITVAGQTFRILQGAQFNDVPLGHPLYTEIGKLAALGITLGCGNGNYCPDANTTREQMAIFIERGLGIFNPPVPQQQTFADVPPTLVGYPFIEDFVARGITTGCAAGPPRLYCPSAPVTREQMAIFILRGLGVFTPPPGPAEPTFADVPNSGATEVSHEFIEEFVRRGITQGCAAGPPRLYCPGALVTRGQMAVFLLRAFGM